MDNLPDSIEAIYFLSIKDILYKSSNLPISLKRLYVRINVDIEDLKQNGYIQENPVDGNIKITGKSEQAIRKKSLDEIFGKLKKTKQLLWKIY